MKTNQFFKKYKLLILLTFIIILFSSSLFYINLINIKVKNVIESVFEIKVDVNNDINSNSKTDLTFILLTDEQKQDYLRKGLERFFIIYRVEDYNEEEIFKKEIEPTLNIFIAYSEYQIETYSSLFNSKTSKDFESISIHVFKSYEDLDMINKSTKKHIIAFSSEFTNAISCFFDYKDTILSEIDLAKTATHEITHILQYSYSKHVTTILSKWFKEGMAEYYQYYPYYLKEFHKDIYNSKTYPQTIQSLEDSFSTENYDSLIYNYIVAEEFYEFLISTTNQEENLLSLLDSSYENFATDFKNMFSISLDDAYLSFLNSRDPNKR